MTSLVHPRQSLRRCCRASSGRPRLPCGGGLRGRITAWDAMGYHGTAWASIDARPASARPGQPDFQALLMGFTFKEGLRGRPGIGADLVAVPQSVIAVIGTGQPSHLKFMALSTPFR